MTVEFETTSAEGVIVMTHVLDAPRELVWIAFTDPKHVVRWYGGRGYTNPVCEMDVRPGGRWHHVMGTPDGALYEFEYVFVEVVRPEKLSWQSVDHGKRKQPPPTCLNVLTLEDLGRVTRSKFVARFTSAAERDLALSFGFTRTLREGVERMDQVLRDLQSPRDLRGGEHS
jgi:uncharacterized protein YndB with AHSA1/START domain